MAKHIRRRRLAITAALLVVGGQAALAAPTAAVEVGTYTVDVDGLTVGAAPEAFVGDADASIRIRLTNTSPSQVLGAADVVVPAPFRLVAAPDDAVAGGPVIELRDLGLPPGGSRDVAATVDVSTCTAGTASPFEVHATAGGDLSGTVLSLVEPSDPAVAAVGSCALAFVDQPTDATRGSTITSVPFDPTGAPVAVEVIDGSATARATSSDAVVSLTAANDAVPEPALGGTTVAVAVAGLATFTPGPTLGESAYGYGLQASSPSVGGPATSDTFAIVDDQVSCPAGEPCAGSASSSEGGASVSVSFGAGPAATNLVVSLGAADAPDFSCARYPRPEDAVVSQFEFLGGSGAGRVGTMTTVIPSARRPIRAYEACWAAPYPFTTDGGIPATVQGTKPGTGEPLYVGVVPDCKPRRWTLPCVKSRTFDRRTRSVTVTVLATGDDPWRY